MSITNDATGVIYVGDDAPVAVDNQEQPVTTNNWVTETGEPWVTETGENWITEG